MLQPGHYYGDLTKRKEISGLMLSEVFYPRGHCTPRHTHERAYFSLVLQGLGDIASNSTQPLCQLAPLMFHSPGALHMGQVRHTGGRSFFIEIKPRLLAYANDHVRLKAGSIAFWGGAANSLAAKLYREFRRMDEASSLAVEGLGFALLAECARASEKMIHKNAPSWLSEAREVVREHFTEKLSLIEIAQTVGIHPVHLATQFRRFYHCTVGDYARRLKVEAACKELIASDRSLADLAVTLGFAHQAHFTHVFREYKGVTPSSYRKQCLQHNAKQNLKAVKDRVEKT